MQYNTSKSKMVIPEYGRNIHKMVDHVKSIEDSEERNKAAQALISIMGNLNPHLRDVEDFSHKLWDHLFIMADFDLEVESPYPLPDREVIEAKPAPLKYPKGRIQHKHYGKVVENLIQKAVEMEEGEEREALIETIGNYMKQSYKNWNNGMLNDNDVFRDLTKISGGVIVIDPENMTLRKVKSTPIRQTNTNNKRRSNNHRNKRKR